MQDSGGVVLLTSLTMGMEADFAKRIYTQIQMPNVVVPEVPPFKLKCMILFIAWSNPCSDGKTTPVSNEK